MIHADGVSWIRTAPMRATTTHPVAKLSKPRRRSRAARSAVMSNDALRRAYRKVKVVPRCDLTTLEVGAIVNASNPGLRRGGGVCGAIFEAAGSVNLQRACDAVSPCPVGEARITPGGVRYNMVPVVRILNRKCACRRIRSSSTIRYPHRGTVRTWGPERRRCPSARQLLSERTGPGQGQRHSGSRIPVYLHRHLRIPKAKGRNIPGD